MRMRTAVAGCLLLAFVATLAAAQRHEAILLDANAYDPVPSPDGKLIAYVVTGRKLQGGSGGFGRSNLETDVKFCDPDGQTLSTPQREGFLGEWLSDSSAVVSFRDWRFALLDLGGGAQSQSMLSDRNASDSINVSERVVYLAKIRKFVWIENSGSHTLLQTEAGPIAVFAPGTFPEYSVIAPSPDGRYLAIAGPELGQTLWVYDTEKKTLVNLGTITIHPDSGWNYFVPAWNPWFPDGKHLAFFSESTLRVASPDGKQRRDLLKAVHAGLAIPSPDGSRIAYATFAARPRKLRHDLNFWAGSLLWIVPSSGGAPVQLTQPSQDETYDLRWLTSDSLIFDRISEGLWNEHARIWTVSIENR